MRTPARVRLLFGRVWDPAVSHAHTRRYLHTVCVLAWVVPLPGFVPQHEFFARRLRLNLRFLA
jgi:hypothetical protein